MRRKLQFGIPFAKSDAIKTWFFVCFETRETNVENLLL
jgi:hypothetical protein